MSNTTVVPSANSVHNLGDYATWYRQFDWEEERKNLNGLPGGKGMNIAYEAVDRHAKSLLSNATALKWIGRNSISRSISYDELYHLTARFAQVLVRLGIQKGETVFALTGRIPELYIAALGALKATAVFCPLYSVFGPEPLYQRLSQGDAKVLVTTQELYEKKVKGLISRLAGLRFILLTDVQAPVSERVLSLPLLMNDAPDEFEVPATDPEDPALLHFTSGTTGMPKGALHIHQAVLMHYMTGKYVLDLHPGDVFWCTADPGWVTGTSYGIIAPLVNGATTLIDEADFDALRWYRILDEQKVNVWYTAPTGIRRLMRMNIRPRDQFNLQSLRVICSVGEPLPAAAVVWGQEMFGMPILDNWWQTETGGIMIANFPAMQVRPGSMGKPLPGIEAAIAQVTETGIQLIGEANTQGHLVLRKGWPSMFRTYLHDDNRYKKCFRDDWYITGDLARKDADGYFWFVGRSDDIIKTSGHMVGPFEVESTLMNHVAVAEAAVIGKPDALIGELVKAFVVLKQGFTGNEKVQLDILAHARRELGPAIAPKELDFVNELPKTRSGKILRRLLKARELGLPEGDISTLE